MTGGQRFFLAAAAGTGVSVIVLGFLAWANGSPFPWGHPAAMAAYPSGSVTVTFLLTWAAYFLSFCLVYGLRGRRGR